MSFDWFDYINIAEILHSQGKGGEFEQACFRCAVSRSYYAAFIFSKKYAETKDQNFEIDGGSSHKRVIEYFTKNKNPRLQIIGEDLKNLKKQRINSDYKDEPKFNSLAVENWIKTSKNIIEDLK
ncbi:MAG: HEPN domain-containing protein [Euryarchaeota archaeon]|nr:HEPN domain-containing protein [Euryarchaeota archaeon]